MGVETSRRQAGGIFILKHWKIKYVIESLIKRVVVFIIVNFKTFKKYTYFYIISIILSFLNSYFVFIVFVFVTVVSFF